MIDRRISLYFAIIGPREAGRLIGAWLMSPFVAAQKRRQRMVKAVRNYLPDADVFLFSSARGALAACLQAAGVGPGDDVLLSAYTCIAVPTAVLAAGARPVYADVDPHTLNTPADVVAAALRPPVRAVVVQHTLGCAADIEAIAAAARERGILVIEDCALALGARRKGRLLGSFADAAIYSMELSKTVTTGWGGVLAVNDSALTTRVAKRYASVPESSGLVTARRSWQAAISGLCYQPSLLWFGQYVIAVAFRFGFFGRSTPPDEERGQLAPDFIRRLGGPQAALGVTQWGRLAKIAERCRENAAQLRDTLQALGFHPLAAPVLDQDEVVASRVSFLVANRQVAIEWFRIAGIELGQWFDGPLSPFPQGLTPFNYDVSHYPSAAFVARHVVNLPSHSRLSPADLAHIKQTLSRYAAAHPEDRAISERMNEPG